MAPLDHLVLTTPHGAACIDFHTHVRGLALETFAGGTPPVTRRAFKFGAQKISLHAKRAAFEHQHWRERQPQDSALSQPQGDTP